MFGLRKNGLETQANMTRGKFYYQKKMASWSFETWGHFPTSNRANQQVDQLDLKWQVEQTLNYNVTDGYRKGGEWGDG